MYTVQISEEQVPLFKAAGFEIRGTAPGRLGRPKSTYRLKANARPRHCSRRLMQVYRDLRDNLDINKSWTMDELVEAGKTVITSRKGSGSLSETSLRLYLYQLSSKGALVAS